jgi:hypothetical protein
MGKQDTLLPAKIQTIHYMWRWNPVARPSAPANPLIGFSHYFHARDQEQGKIIQVQSKMSNMIKFTNLELIILPLVHPVNKGDGVRRWLDK